MTEGRERTSTQRAGAAVRWLQACYGPWEKRATDALHDVSTDQDVTRTTRAKADRGTHLNMSATRAEQLLRSGRCGPGEKARDGEFGNMDVEQQQ